MSDLAVSPSSATAGAPPPALTSRARRASPELSVYAFAAVLALGFALIMLETRGFSFFGDEWDFVLHRRGMSAATLLQPHGPHLSLAPIIVYKIFLQVFGASSYLPYRVLAALDLVGVALVLGYICRREWGPWWGLIPPLLLVTLGTGATTLLWPFQVGYALAIISGLIALYAVQSAWRGRDAIACAALLLSLASASQGIGFVAGAAMMLLLTRGGRRRLWVAVVPAVLYGIWYLAYGRHGSETQLALWHTTLNYLMQGLSATLAGISGTSSVSLQTGLLDGTFGIPLAVGLLAVLAAALWRGWRPQLLFWGVVVTLVVLWTAASMSNTATVYRPPQDPRYLSSNATLVLVALCAACPRPRLPSRAALAALPVLAAVCASNAWQFNSTGYLAADVQSRALLGGMLIMRGDVSPSFSPFTPAYPGLLGVDARSYFASVTAFGTQADAPRQILRQPEPTREAVDRELASGEGIMLRQGSGAQVFGPPPAVLSGIPARRNRCLYVQGGNFVVRAGPGVYRLVAGHAGPLGVGIGRFASTYDVALGSVPPSGVDTLVVPRDRAQIPWRMILSGSGGVCWS